VFILLACVADFVSISASIKSQQVANSGFCQLICYVNVVYGFIFDYLFFGQSITTEEMLGAGLIIIVMVAVGLRKLNFKLT
jgi:drug/metabolite transporter (DMT)-like permease